MRRQKIEARPMYKKLSPKAYVALKSSQMAKAYYTCKNTDKRLRSETKELIIGRLSSDKDIPAT